MNGYERFFKEARKVNGLDRKAGTGASGTGAVHSSRGGERRSSGGGKTARGPVAPSTSGGGPKSRREAMTPERKLRQMLEERMREKKRIVARERQNFPLFPAVITGLLLLGCGLGYFMPNGIDWMLGSVRIGAFSHAQAEGDGKTSREPEATSGSPIGEDAAKSAAILESPTATSAEAKVPDEQAKALDVRQWSPGELSFFNKLNERSKALDLREAELNKLEEELQRQKSALEEKIKRLETMRSQISKTLKTRIETDQEKVDKLVEFYSNMKPQQAAKVIESLNEDLAVEVLDKMKKKNAAEILNMMNARKARHLSEMLTGYRRGPAADTDTDTGSDRQSQETEPSPEVN